MSTAADSCASQPASRAVFGEPRAKGAERPFSPAATHPASFVKMSDEPIPGDWKEPHENILRGMYDRILQILARMLPGARSLRVLLHRARGVKIGKGVWIGYDVVLDTARPELIVIEDDVAISMRALVIAHFKEQHGIRIEREAFIGPGAIILPGVSIGHGAVVKAGSVVSHSVPAMTVVQGNPAVPVARCGIPFRQDVSLKSFARYLRPLTAPPASDRQALERSGERADS